MTAAAHSDTLVVFGVTGDLAHKMIFPALYALVAKGALNVPIVGVASPNWTLEQLHARITESIEHAGVSNTTYVLPKLLSLVTFVCGDYRDAETFQSIKKALGGAQRP